MLDSLMHLRLRPALFITPLVAACAISGGDEEGPNNARAQSSECAARVIVRLAVEPDDALLADLGRANALTLEPQGVIANDLRAYVLRAAGPEAECVAAIARLRRDQRVRSVDLDSQRELHDD
jgi:hypothetical protein